MDRYKKVLVLCIISIALVTLKTQDTFTQQTDEEIIPEKYQPSYHELVLRLKKRGFNIEKFTSNELFEFYENIDSFYKNSPEKKGKNAYQEALRKGNKYEAEKLLKEEYDNYKKSVGFTHKKIGMSSFLERYSARLTKSELEYGIPKEVIAAVIGMESQFGVIIGKHRAFNVYVSMYIKNYRKKFAVEQLEELMKFSRRNHTGIFEYRSSYAGAIGFMQFLPWSLNRWFVGNDVYNMDDAIASVAFYLSHFKEKRGTLERAIYAYNPNKFYVKTIIELTNSVGKSIVNE